MPFKVINKTEAAGEILIYGEIWDMAFWDGEVSPSEILNKLEPLKNSKQIDVRINSGGGEISAGIAIYNALKNHPANITVHIDGMAASIAGVIAMAGDKILIAKNAMFMIHKASAGFWGDSTEFRKMADVLEKYEETIVGTFVDRTGQSEAQIRLLMDEETYLTGEEAVVFGFADELIANKTVEATNVNGKYFINKVQIDVSKFNKIPKNFFKNQEESAPEPEPAKNTGVRTEPIQVPESQEPEPPELEPTELDFSIYENEISNDLSNILIKEAR